MESKDTTFEQQVFELTNQERTKAGLQPLQTNAELNYTADKYAQTMSENRFFSHTGQDGSQPWDRAKAVGYEAQTMGENIAAGQKTPGEVVQAWMNSPGHRANILRSQYKDLGVGFEKNYWVQNFGSGDTNPASYIPGSESNTQIPSNPTPPSEPVSTPTPPGATSNPTTPSEPVSTPTLPSEPVSTPTPPESTSNQGGSPNSNQTIPKPPISSDSFEPTAYEQYMLELINRARANPQAEEQRQNIPLTQGLSPQSISYEAKQPLAWNTTLSKAAQDHNKWQEQTGTISHYGDGGSPWERAYKAGYDMTAPQSSQANENLAMGGGSTPKSATQYAEERHNSLYGSGGHRANFFNSDWKEAGIDFLGQQASDGQNLTKSSVVEFFGKPASDNTFLTGVAYNDLVKDDDFYTPGEGLGGIKVEAVRQSDNKLFTTQTSSSGGYQMALEPGDYKVTFSEGKLNEAITNTAKIDSKNVKLDLVSDKLVNGIYHSSDSLTGGDPSDILTGQQSDGMGYDRLEADPGYPTFVASQGENVDLIKNLVTNVGNTEPLPGLGMDKCLPIENGMFNHTKSLIAAPGNTIPTPSLV
ncbi:CAP domain-containing protein [Brasilonema bromeliae]|uniref:SCP domain-containing protein n=1 Tax=Brasilonema bromeliae SPC951 TaxID=385972 RepID=A0ABX1P221_9CYAN|nr:CAP domain-containing protein [Brasilonema bromeliae]NMG18369.1 hypothetical protein [Brasilonema bromeliae SPC951]